MLLLALPEDLLKTRLVRIVLVEGAESATEEVRRALGGHDVRQVAELETAVLASAAQSANLLLVVWPQNPSGPAANLHPLLRNLPCPVIVFLGADRVVERRALTGAGIRYLPFPVDREELGAHLRRLGSADGDGRTYAGDICLDRHLRRVTRAGADLHLTRKEFELLDHLIRHRRMVQTKDQLLDAVWGSNDFSPNVVEVAISGLRRKLEAHGERVLETVRGVGYLYQPEIEEVPQLNSLMSRRKQLLDDRQRLIEERDRIISARSTEGRGGRP